MTIGLEVELEQLPPVQVSVQVTVSLFFKLLIVITAVVPVRIGLLLIFH